MRTFIAIEPPEGWRREVGRLTRALEAHFPGVRWCRPESLHLTLRFLGEIDPGRLEALAEAVRTATAPRAPFRVGMTGIGSFGPRLQPRVIWLGLADSPELMGLAGEVERRIEAAGFGPADKPFKPHLTLARVKDPLRHCPDWETIERLVSADWPAWPVEEVQVIKSTLQPQGPLYETLASCRLGG